MVLSYKKIVVIVFILLLKTKEGFTASIDTTNLLAFHQSVYEASPVTFNSGDYVKGFVAFAQGFSISSGTVQFGTVGTVSGTIDLNGGTLQLTDDLHLGSNVSLNGPGSIDMQGHTIFFSDYTNVQTQEARGYGGRVDWEIKEL